MQPFSQREIQLGQLQCFSYLVSLILGIGETCKVVVVNTQLAVIVLHTDLQDLNGTRRALCFIVATAS